MRKQRGVFERPPGSGTWWIDYRDSQGKRRREKVGRRSYALRLYKQRQEDISAGRFVASKRASAGGPTFAELAAERMTQREVRLAAASQRADRCRLQPLLLAFGGLAGAAVTPERIDMFLSGIVKSGRSRSTANRFRSLLSSIFSLGVRNGRIAANPCVRVQPFKENPGRVRFLSESEEERLRSAIEELYPTRLSEFELAINTGLRRGEQYGLRREGVNLELGVATVVRKSGQRHVPLNAAARAAVAELMARNSGTYVCARGQRNWFEKCLKAANIENFCFHSLRHTFASRLVMSGVHMRSVQDLLGHKTLAMTLRYSHLAPEFQRAAIERLAGHQPGTVQTANSGQSLGSA